jgi:hypothetical protein
MDVYHVWFNLKPGVRDVEFCDRVTGYLGHLQNGGRIERFRITRRKLGFGPAALGEFHVTIETRDLAQLDQAFALVARRDGEVEELHASVNQYVTDFTTALYRDFPDAARTRGEEKF